jgi:hypothetical protein
MDKSGEIAGFGLVINLTIIIALDPAFADIKTIELSEYYFEKAIFQNKAATL